MHSLRSQVLWQEAVSERISDRGHNFFCGGPEPDYLARLVLQKLKLRLAS